MNNRNFNTVAPIIAFIMMAFVISSCEGRGKSHDNDESSPDTISVAEAKQIIDSQMNVSDQSKEFEAFAHNKELLVSESAPCNLDGEPFNDFIHHFITDPKFRVSRLELIDNTIDIPSDIDQSTFEQKEPDEEDFFSAWRVLEKDTVIFSSGWMNSEVAEEYTFVRKDDRKWYLRDYFSIENMI